jgi:hypothetical protein
VLWGRKEEAINSLCGGRLRKEVEMHFSYIRWGEVQVAHYIEILTMAGT